MTEIQKQLARIKMLAADAELEAARFEGPKGVDAAGTRLRKQMQEIKEAAQAVREEVTETRKGRG